MNHKSRRQAIKVEHRKDAKGWHGINVEEAKGSFEPAGH